jgi:hypothetical protein
MKKTTIKLLSILTITVFTFSSCTKDRTCECTITESSTLPGDQTEVGEYEIEFEKVSKKWMKNSAGCVSRTETEDNIDYDYAVDANGNMIFDANGYPIMIETPYTITTESDCEIN